MDVSGLRQGRSNMPMHPTGDSLSLIENLNDNAVVSRRVIGGVRFLPLIEAKVLI
jgi:hypothetical protein